MEHSEMPATPTAASKRLDIIMQQVAEQDQRLTALLSEYLGPLARSSDRLPWHLRDLEGTTPTGR